MLNGALLSDHVGMAVRGCRPYHIATFGFGAAVSLLYLAPALYSFQLYDRVLLTGGVLTLVFLTAFLAVALLVLGLLDRVRGRILAMAGSKLDSELVPEILAASFAPNAPETAAGGQALRDFDTLRGMLAGPLLLSMMDLPFALLFLALCIVIHPLLGGLVALVSAMLLGITLIGERRQAAAVVAVARTSARLNAAQAFEARQADTVRGLGMGEALVMRQVRRRQRASDILTQSALATVNHRTVAKVLRVAAQSAVLGLAAWLVVDRQISAGAMLASSMLAARAFLPFEQLAGGWRQLGLATSAAANLNALLTAGAAAPTRTRLPNAIGRLSIEGLVLGYDRRVVVEGLNLMLEPGTFLGIVGPSGSGKSTLAKAIVGAVTPLAGTIRLDSAALADWPAEQRADAIGFGPQELDLFEGTIAENIARFRQFLDDSDLSAAVVAAAQHSHAHAMILRLPAGYETLIGHGGEGLSVGQRQRISLARAVFGSPALVVLDEPNAQIDAAGEAALVDMLARLKAARVTLVVVAHRLRILDAADRIVALENGGVVFDGPPGQLFAKAGRLPIAPAQRENVA